MISEIERKPFAVSRMLPLFMKPTLSNGSENVKCMKNVLLLERDLEVLSIAQAQQDEQKQQNLFLKEIIDRVRYEIDEMRNAAPGNIAGSGLSSAANTISKSLGAELMGKMKFDLDSDEDLEEGDTAVEDDKTEGEEEEEDVQTIITKILCGFAFYS
jgi:hypothetical protein